MKWKTLNIKKIAHGIYLKFSNQSKSLSVDIWVTKMHFPPMYIFVAPFELAGPGMLSSIFVKSPSFAQVPCGRPPFVRAWLWNLTWYNSFLQKISSRKSALCVTLWHPGLQYYNHQWKENKEYYYESPVQSLLYCRVINTNIQYLRKSSELHL